MGFFCVSLDISDITKLDPLKFGKIVYLCYIPRKFPGKTQDNFTSIFLDLPGIFQVAFKWLLKILHAICWIPREILYHQPPSPLRCLCFSPEQSNFEDSVLVHSPVRKKITYQQLLVGFFHQLILFNAGSRDNMLHLHVTLQLPSL